MEKINSSLFGVQEGVICQQVNCCGVMGAGLAKAIMNEYPIVKEKYDECYKRSTTDYNFKYKMHKNQFGSYMTIPLTTDHRLYVANIYSQDFYGNAAKTGKIYTNLNVLIKLISKIAVEYANLPIFIPIGIGCGFGGEKWENIEKELIMLAGVYDNLFLLDTRSWKTTHIESSEHFF